MLVLQDFDSTRKSHSFIGILKLFAIGCKRNGRMLRIDWHMYYSVYLLVAVIHEVTILKRVAAKSLHVWNT